jgi:ribose 5-phosphate isomerase B
MRLAFAADHAGYELKDVLMKWVQETRSNVSVIDLGTNTGESVDYPDFGRAAAEKVASGEADFAIIVCGSGIGISIAANRVAGARCALVNEPTSARLCREHNDANMLSLGARLIGEEVARDCVTAFLNTPFGGGRHQKRVEKLG